MKQLRIVSVIISALLAVAQLNAQALGKNVTGEKFSEGENTEWFDWSLGKNGTNFHLLTAPQGFKVPLNTETLVTAALIVTTQDFRNIHVTVEMTEDNIPIVGNVTITPCNLTLGILKVRENPVQNHSLPAYTAVSTLSQDSTCHNISFKVHGKLLGYSEADFMLAYTDLMGRNISVSLEKIRTTCFRLPRIIDWTFRILVMTMVFFAMLAMGANIELRAIKEHLKKPKAPICALISQYIFMPLVSYALIHALSYTGGMALGIFLWGCSPGGNNSNMISKLINGNMSLSVALTTISTLLSIVMLPFWVYTLGSTLPGNDITGKIKIPYLSMLQSLAIIIVPILIGLLIKWKAPRVQRFLKRFLKVFFIVLIIFMFTLGIYANLYMFKLLTWKMIITSAMMPISGFAFGALLAFAFRLDWKVIKTVALETGMQNTGVPLMVLQASLLTPDLELSMLAPISASLGTSIPVYIATGIYVAYHRFCAKNDDTESETHQNSEELQEISELKKLTATPDDPENDPQNGLKSPSNLDDNPPDYRIAADPNERKELI